MSITIGAALIGGGGKDSGLIDGAVCGFTEVFSALTGAETAGAAGATGGGAVMYKDFHHKQNDKLSLVVNIAAVHLSKVLGKSLLAYPESLPSVSGYLPSEFFHLFQSLPHRLNLSKFEII